jgi:hypothetical protein
MYLCNMEMTREALINYAHACEVQRLVSELPNDMDLGKAVRALTTKVTDQITRLQTEDAKDPNTK